MELPPYCLRAFQTTQTQVFTLCTLVHHSFALFQTTVQVARKGGGRRGESLIAYFSGRSLSIILLQPPSLLFPVLHLHLLFFFLILILLLLLLFSSSCPSFSSFPPPLLQLWCLNNDWIMHTDFSPSSSPSSSSSSSSSSSPSLFSSSCPPPPLLQLWCLNNDRLMHRLPSLLTGRYWELIQRLQVNQFYTAPTALRLLLKAGDEYVHKYDRSSVRILGCGQWAWCMGVKEGLCVNLAESPLLGPIREEPGYEARTHEVLLACLESLGTSLSRYNHSITKNC